MRRRGHAESAEAQQMPDMYTDEDRAALINQNAHPRQYVNEEALRTYQKQTAINEKTPVQMTEMTEKFILTTVDPRVYSVMPPSDNNNNCFTKEQTIFGTINGAASKNGAILYMINRSSDTLVLLVPNAEAGGTATAVNFPIAPCGPMLTKTTPVQAYSQYVFSVDIGYYLPALDQKISVSPDLALQFSQSRQFAAWLQVVSDTTSTTSAAMSGEMHASAVSDIRGMRQLKSAEMAQNTITQKDAVLSVPASTGVMCLQGPDIPANFTAPSAQFAIDDGFSGVGDPIVGPVFDFSASVSGIGIPAYIFTAPGIKATRTVSGFDTATMVALDDFPPLECVDFDIFVTNSPGVFPQSIIQVVDVWAYIDPDAAVGLQLNTFCVPSIYTVVQEGTLVMGLGTTTGDPLAIWAGYNGLAAQTQKIQHRSQHGRPELDNLALKNMIAQGVPATVPARYYWIGCSISYPMPANATTGAAGGGYFAGTTAQVSFVPIARSIYRPGFCGPARILKWDNVAAGQNIQVKGSQRQQLVATNKLAPFLSSIGEDGAINASLLPMTQLLYNGPSDDFKRVWSIDRYREYIKKITAGDGGARFFQSGVNNGLSAKQRRDGHAAGLFQSIMRAGGAIARNLPGMINAALPYAQAALAGGADGMFGDNRAGSSRGMFGASAGTKRGRSDAMFGAACGNGKCNCEVPGSCGGGGRHGSAGPIDEYRRPYSHGPHRVNPPYID